jgi:tetratricopeptide (TPR) repeat protein
MNFFARQLYEYFVEGGKQIPPQILTVLSKPLSSLIGQEIDVYNQQIGPYQDKIRTALRNRYIQQGSPAKQWSEEMSPYYRPIIEEFAVQIMGNEYSAPLPVTLAPRIQYKMAETRKEGILARLTIPSLSYKWLIIALVVIVLLGTGGWLLYSATEPSRMLNGIKGELKRGEYSLALQHIDEMEEKHNGKKQTEEAGGLKPEAALGYANELLERARFEEAVLYFGIADASKEFEEQALLGRTRAYDSWARALSENGEYANSFECCESALACAPDGYDTNPLMELRAQVLFSWGEALRGQQDYLAAASRFEKCYREWPAGALANRALENYVDAAVAYYTGWAPPAKSASAGGSVQIRMNNQTGYVLKCFYSGPSTMCFDLAPGEKRTIYILPGIYSTAYVIERVGYGAHANDDFTKPTNSNSWWEVTLPTLQDIVRQGVSYEQIMARIEELKASLPPEILDCVEDLEYGQRSGGQMSDYVGEFSPSENTIYYNPPLIDVDELDGVIFHEWGHAYSSEYLDNEEKEAYKVLRDISVDIPWDNFDSYYLSVEEDFAEVFAVVFGNVEWSDYTWYGPVGDTEVLKGMIISAAE